MARGLTETNVEMLARTIGTLEVATWGAVVRLARLGEHWGAVV